MNLHEVRLDNEPQKMIVDTPCGEKSDHQLSGCGGTCDVSMFRRAGDPEADTQKARQGLSLQNVPFEDLPQGAGGLARGQHAGHHEIRLGPNRERSPSKGPGCVVTVRD